MSSSSSKIENAVRDALNDVRPALLQDGGDVEFVRYEAETQVIEVRLLGNCKTCPISPMTLRAGIERYILLMVPEVRRIEAVP